MSNDSFTRFLSDFRSLHSSLSSRVSSIPKQNSLSGQQGKLEECQQASEELQALLQSIEPELRHYDYSTKQRAQQQLRECRIQYEQQVRLLSQYSSALSAGQPIGAANPENSTNGFSEEQKAQYKKQRELLLGTHSNLSDGNSSLDNTSRLLAETTAVGTDTTLTLQKQREQFINQRETLHETDNILSRSKATLRRMQKRIMTNRLVSCAIILAEAGVCALIVYLKYYK